MNAFLNYISYYLPEKVLDNNELSADFGNWTADQIYKKTGILYRHISTPSQFNSDLALVAYQNLIRQEGVFRNDIDFLIYVTQTPEYLLPGSSYIFQTKANINIPSIDLSSGCSGFNNALFIAKNLIVSKAAKKVLIITSETYSKIINKLDKSVRTLFGDASSASIVSADEIGFKIGNFDQGTSPQDFNKLIVPGMGLQSLSMSNLDVVNSDENGYLRTLKNIFMDGPSIMSFTLNFIPNSIKRTMEVNSIYNFNEIDHILLHQASLFVLNSLKQKLKIEDNQNFIINLEDKGNTVSSSIPIALKENLHNFKKNSKVLTSGFGVGLAWSSCIMVKV